MAETVSEKAHRIFGEGRVVPLPDTATGVRRFEVHGDGGVYLVRWHEEAWTCTCPARGRCSHELASILSYSAEHAGGNVVNPMKEER